MQSTPIVFIVDDDEAVRLATARLVRSFGWSTHLFASAEELLQSPQVGEASFLISDVRMPGISGVDMHNQLLKMGHAPPTIFITAFPTAALEAKVHMNSVVAVLTKPFDDGDLAHWLNVALGTP